MFDEGEATKEGNKHSCSPDAKSAQQTNNAQPIGERRVVWETGGGLFSLPETETALRRRRWGSENMEAVTTRGHLQRVSALS